MNKWRQGPSLWGRLAALWLVAVVGVFMVVVMPRSVSTPLTGWVSRTLHLLLGR
jgi:hypothetical protein